MGPLTDINPYGAEADGVWFNRVHTYEHSCDSGGREGGNHDGGNRDSGSGRTVHFPRSCLHCETPACVTVCPTGASYKRASDGIVLVNEDKCMGCQLCSWACPYGARELDTVVGVMKKCTLCIDRIYNHNLEPEDRVPACVAACPTGARHFGDLGDPASPVSRLVSERGGVDLMPELGYRPVNKYLPPRPRAPGTAAVQVHALESADPIGGFLGWVDRMLSSRAES
jgi:Fe-S-cluster-containing dehydrogenase component